MVIFKKNGVENGKSAYLVQRKAIGSKFSFASIAFDGSDWVLRRLPNGRVDRFERLEDAKQEARKS